VERQVTEIARWPRRRVRRCEDVQATMIGLSGCGFVILPCRRGWVILRANFVIAKQTEILGKYESGHRMQGSRAPYRPCRNGFSGATAPGTQRRRGLADLIARSPRKRETGRNLIVEAAPAPQGEGQRLGEPRNDTVVMRRLKERSIRRRPHRAGLWGI